MLAISWFLIGYTKILLKKSSLLWLYPIFRHANLWLPSLSVYPWGPTHQMCSQVPVLVSFDWLVLIASPSVAILQLNNSLPPPVFLCYFPKFVHSTPTLVGCRHPSCLHFGGRALIWSFQPLRKIVSSLGCKIKTHLKNRTVLSFHVSEAAFHKAQPPPVLPQGREEQIRRACCLAPSPGRSENCKLAHTFGPEKANIMIAIGNGSPTNIHNNDENENADSDDNSWQLKVLRKWDTTRN